jgi:AraC-like DNA-binding protein
LAAPARVEALFEKTQRSPGARLAELAAERGYADQSDMRREVKRVTGHSPGRILELIRTDARFWFYRLMSKQFLRA